MILLFLEVLRFLRPPQAARMSNSSLELRPLDDTVPKVIASLDVSTSWAGSSDVIS